MTEAPPSVGRTLSATVTSVLWMIGSMGLFRYLDFGVVMFYDDRVSRGWLKLAAVCSFTAVSIALFLICWATYWKKIPTDEWEIRYPYLIPVATLSMTMCFFAFNVAFWSKYRFLTPVIAFIFTMGFVSLISLLPDDGSARLPKSIHME